MPPHPEPLPWRDAVRDLMYQATLEELRGRYGSVETSFNYRWEHVATVVTLALRLAEQTGGDAEIVEAAAWLHDVCKFTHGEHHPAAGAGLTRDFLPRTDFPPGKIEPVARAIEQHKGLWRDTPLEVLEAQILWDADKLAKIGLTAAFHWLGASLAGSQPRTMEELMARGRAADWQTKTVASMHTAPARRAARQRLEAYNSLWETLGRELAGDDLEE